MEIAIVLTLNTVLNVYVLYLPPLMLLNTPRVLTTFLRRNVLIVLIMFYSLPNLLGHIV